MTGYSRFWAYGAHVLIIGALYFFLAAAQTADFDFGDLHVPGFELWDEECSSVILKILNSLSYA